LLPEFTLGRVARFTLARHFLTKQAERRALVQVVGQICGLNAQSARGQYLSLWSRIKRFSRGDLTKALYSDRSVIRAWLMRGTVHAVPAQDFAIYQKAVGRVLVVEWDELVLKHDPDLHRMKPKLYPAVMEALGPESLTKQELIGRLPRLLKGQTPKTKMRLVGRALRGLTFQGRVCHAEPTGPWYHFKDNRYAALSSWQPDIDLDGIGEASARKELLRRYLRAYGPASVQDFAYWSGLKAGETRKVFEALRRELTEVSIRGQKGSYWLLSDDLDAIRGAQARRIPTVRFLPEFDPLIMGHKVKDRILDPGQRKKVFLRLADVAPTMLVAGRVAGTWNFRFTDRSLTQTLFHAVPDLHKSSIQRKASCLIRFLKQVR
jgi:hypothetical protein